MANRSDMLKDNQAIRAALDTAKIMTWIYDIRNKRFSDSGSFGRLYHLPTIIENIPDSILETGIIHPDSEDELRRIIAQAGRGEIARGDIRCMNDDSKEYVWKRVNYTPIFNEDGVCEESIGTAVDITERKEREIRYQKQLESMAKVDDVDLISKGQQNLTTNEIIFYQRNRDGALVLEPGSRYDDAITSLAAMAVKKEKQGEIAQTFARERLLINYEEGRAEGSVEYQRNMPNEEICWVATKYALFEEPTTCDIIAFIYSYDITDRVVDRQIVAKLGSMEYDALGLLNVSTHHYVLRSILTQLEGPSIIGEGDFDERVIKRLPETLASEDKDHVIQQFYVERIVKELDRKNVYSVNYAVYDDKQQIRYKKMRFSYLDDTRAQVLYCRSDVTDIYIKEQEQLKQTEDALKRAKEANHAKSDFLSRMSHDIRTPMNTIMNLTRLVREEIDDREAALNDLSKIETSNQFLLSLVNDILDMSRIEQKRMELHPEQYDYQEFYDYIASTFVPLCKEKEIGLSIEEDGKNLNVMVDKVRFNQLCFNLLSNAVKYTPKGGHIIFRVTHGEAHDGKLLCDFYVIDDGIGMTEEFQEQMYEPFSQEGRAFASVEGTGLGLSIVKEIVDLLDGTIEVQSQVDKGSTFHVHIDMLLASRHAEILDEEIIDYDRLKGRHILVVEDHPLNQEIARRLLEKVGITVDIAENGLKAVEEIRGSIAEYDGVLMDMRMPVMDGLEATRQIRHLDVPGADTIPIIAMTANAFAEDRTATREAGMNAHLSKPIEPKKLYLTLQKYL